MERSDDLIDLGVATVETKGQTGARSAGALGQVLGCGLAVE